MELLFLQQLQTGYSTQPSAQVSSLTANPSGPSDIHGGAFTLMFETKIKYDGYGILASKGTAGDMNKAGGHSIVLEAGGNYTQANHFLTLLKLVHIQIVIPAKPTLITRYWIPLEQLFSNWTT